jgi:crotonobetainyl-CoA:carnitine CoA-transferase CaiB-like acyl-CoA transferase
VAELDAGFGALTFAEAARRLDAEDVVWSPILSAIEVTRDPQALAAGCFVEMEDGEGGQHLSPATPVRFPGTEDKVKGPAPRKGQHTRDVLARLGLTAAQIADLEAIGAVAVG